MLGSPAFIWWGQKENLDLATHINISTWARKTNIHNRTSVLVPNAAYHMIFKRLLNFQVYAWRLSPSCIIWPLSSRWFFPSPNATNSPPLKNCQTRRDGLSWSTPKRMKIRFTILKHVPHPCHFMRLSRNKYCKRKLQTGLRFVLQQPFIILKGGGGWKRSIWEHMTHKETYDCCIKWVVVILAGTFEFNLGLFITSSPHIISEKN